ncbi:hypothetical protein SAMN05444344_2830 [Tenacibaculum mesophilum]|uniref:Uncharacterized protein n=1 Tax=Tenacibaculum mesophilum TaxID=104268 RepID=A0ABM7CF16_9FLAO|nr:hypothetical protein [Tenacibaculum mesophilum]AZJ32371.1 hypothetical protein D6200_07280 [Tenacibaculum mesophilum]QFS27626.1 hypothetical protein F9Y86_04135 [Tenacibaculum mesophilum]SHG12866.1 hypothetical protein SAMN05444344_2830 [Tenacibaculum mesophilum]
MKKTYNNSKEITKELKLLKLKRDISLEEIKLVKEQFKEDLSVGNWFQTIFEAVGKFGVYTLARKFLK